MLDGNEISDLRPGSCAAVPVQDKPPQSGFAISKDGTRIYYEVRGSGPVLIISNNFFMTAQQWRNLTPTLPAHCTLVTYDLRHQGKSDRNAMKISIGDHVEDLRALVTQLKVSNVCLLGTCVSTLIVRDFCVAYPEYVSAVIFSGPIFSAFGNLFRKFLHKSLLNTLKSQGAAGLFDHYYPLLYTARGIEANRIPGYLALKRTFVQNNPVAQLEKHLESTLNAEDSLDVLQKITVPALLLCGEDDFLTSRASLEVLVSVLPKARYELIPMAGHNPYVEAGAQFEEAVRRFMEEAAMVSPK